MSKTYLTPQETAFLPECNNERSIIIRGYDNILVTMKQHCCSPGGQGWAVFRVRQRRPTLGPGAVTGCARNKTIHSDRPRGQRGAETTRRSPTGAPGCGVQTGHAISYATLGGYRYGSRSARPG